MFELITFVANYRMTHLGLFEGIGGFSLAARWMGWETLAWCEWNEFGQKVLKHYFPEAEGFGDITKTDFTKYANRIDILTGGFPCQPYSAAGKRLGKEDERHLWPHMCRVIREVQPSWVVGENVLGLVNWSGGLVFHEVQADLEAAGYEVFPFVLPACAVNAPHRRDRVWFVANSNRNDERLLCRPQSKQPLETHALNSNIGRQGDAADTKHKGLEGQCREWKGCTEHRTDKGVFIGAEDKLNATYTNGIGLRRQSDGIGKSRFTNEAGKIGNWQNFPTQSPICFGDDGLSARLDSITFPKWRNESIKAAGNAIVPQVAFQIFKSIAEYESLQSS